MSNTRYYQREIECHKCKKKWRAEFYYESDTNYRNHVDENKGPFCPKCGHEEKEGDGCVICDEQKARDAYDRLDS